MAKGAGKKRFQLNRYAALGLIALGAVLLLASVGTVMAKYTHGNGGYGVAVAPNFYFNSDILTDSGESYKLNPGTQSIKFTLRNHADDLRFSDDDIHYTVTVTTDDTTVTLTPSVGSPSTSGTLTGSLTKAQKSDVTITLEGLEDGKTYTVQAVGKASFTETLTAVFTVEKAEDGVFMHVKNTDAYKLLTVWSEVYVGEATIHIPEGLIPDNTWPGMEGYTKDTREITVTFDGTDTSYISYAFRFFVGADYDGSSEITVTYDSDDKNATQGEPK